VVPERTNLRRASLRYIKLWQNVSKSRYHHSQLRSSCNLLSPLSESYSILSQLCEPFSFCTIFCVVEDVEFVDSTIVCLLMALQNVDSAPNTCRGSTCLNLTGKPTWPTISQELREDAPSGARKSTDVQSCAKLCKAIKSTCFLSPHNTGL
jgi:hypothetical protein